MSRWDALRPERRECSSRKAFSKAPPSTIEKPGRPIDSSLDWHRQLTKLNDSLKNDKDQYADEAMDKLEALFESGADIPPKFAGDAIMSLTTAHSRCAETRRLQLTARILVQHKIIMTNRQVKQCVDNLNCFTDPCRIECLARMILAFSRQMQAEVTANELVGSTLLPVLEDEPSENTSAVLDALQCLLNDPLHASALLAPLTVNVTEEGQEDTITNPLRSRLMRTLQSLLRNTTYSDKACVCLISIVKSTNPPAGDANAEIDLPLLNSFFTARTREKTGNGTAFELIRVILKAYPTTSTGFSNLLIGDRRSEGHTDGSSCVYCKYQNAAPLLDLLHDNDNNRITNVVSCIQELLESLPLHLWLSTGRPSTGVHHFGKRTKDSLVRLLQVVECRFQHHPSSNPVFLYPLIHVILTRIPFSKNGRDELTREAMQLLSIMSQELLRRPRQELVECFVSCMGGRPQPQGGMSLMPVPMHMWLSSFLSRDFRENLWNSSESRTAFREDAVKVLCAIVQSIPSFVLDDEDTWNRCQRLIMSYSSDSLFRIRLDGVTLLEALLSGRTERGGVDGDSEKIALFASSTAWKHLNDPKPHFRNASLNCYGCLLSNDWLMLSKVSDSDGRPSCQEQVDGVLALCVKPSEPNAGVRSKACKSIGHICTQYLSSLFGKQTNSPIDYDDEATRIFCRAVCETLLISLQDSSAIRGMAIFAVGNLAHALRESESKEVLIPPKFIRPLCEAVNHSLNESNGKVVNNAIRTIGHLVSLTFRPPYIDSGAFHEWSVTSFYDYVLGELDRKIETALMSETCRNASWKQRSTAKRHGWGACNALALVLDCDKAFTESNLIQAQDSLRLLVQCIDEAGSLHEKVASAATAAIRKISDTALTIISNEAGIVGMALSPCLLQLYRVKMQHENKARLELELKLLLAHLLRATTISDACYLLRQEDIGKSTLEFLYEWMVDENMPLGAFESFALALQRRDLMEAHDVGLQQKFASRVLQMNRNPDDNDNDEL